MDKKLLLFDLDDTLLTSEKTITSSSVEAIKACKKEGMLIGYITARARPMKSGVFFTDQYNLPNDFIAYYNGAEMYVGGTSIESNTIPYENAMEIILELDRIYPEAKIGVYHEPWSYLKRSGCSYGENCNFETGEKIKCGINELPDYDVQRIRIEFNTDGSDRKLSEILTQNVNFFINSDNSAIIINKNATKEHALEKASEYFSIPLSDIISFGDDINDMNMLKISGIGVAMGNAISTVKEIADYITETNDNEGIAKWINKYLLGVI